MDRLLKTSGKLLHMVDARSDDQAGQMSQQVGRGSIFSFKIRLHLGKVQEKIDVIRVGRNVVN